MPKPIAQTVDSARPASPSGGVKRWRLALSAGLGCVAMMNGSAAVAQGDIALGRHLAAECTGCHQLSGRTRGAIPPIVGWPEDQIVAVLESYARKERGEPTMQAIASGLSRAEMAALAAYLGALAPKP